MATYAIGDIQGCYKELLELLDKINFDQKNDRLWFTGDLVNRGPQSLDTLRFVKSLGEKAVVTLGNHDLHLLAVASRHAKLRTDDTVDEVINASDWPELRDWVRNLPFLHHESESGFTMIHAGLLSDWDMHQAKDLALEAENVLRSDNYLEFFTHMYGDAPDKWEDSLSGWERLRIVVNAFTRLRFCDKSGRLALKEKGPPGVQNEPYLPWFTVPSRKTKNEKIIFGHWSTVYLGNIKNFQQYNVYPVDTGCLWGGSLTALRLEDESWFSVPSQQPKAGKD